MNNEKDMSLKLRALPPKTTHLNKPIIIFVGALILIAFLWAIVSAFQSNTTSQVSSEKLSASNMTPVVDKTVSQLPNDYRDKQKINQYLHHEPIQPKVTIPVEVQQELASLRNQQTYLQQQLEQLSTKHQQTQAPVDDAVTQQARTSGLFFPGGAPKEINDINKSANGPTSSNPSSSTPMDLHHPVSTYDRQNMQVQKLQFVQSKDKPGDIYDTHPLEKPVSPYEVMAGTIIPTSLISAIDSSLPGQVIAQVRENIYDTVRGYYLLIPEGSKIIGQYDSQVSYGQNRILIVFNRIIRPDGSSILLDKYTGTDAYGQSGLQGNINNHWGKIFGAAAISTLLSFGAGATTDNMSSGSDYYRSAQQNAVLGAANNISQVGQNITDRSMNIQPTITLPQGYEFNVIVRKDMVLAPYGQPVE